MAAIEGVERISRQMSAADRSPTTTSSRTSWWSGRLEERLRRVGDDGQVVADARQRGLDHVAGGRVRLDEEELLAGTATPLGPGTMESERATRR
jgi:hypothetical protein